jgi:hypothetical protein
MDSHYRLVQYYDFAVSEIRMPFLQLWPHCVPKRSGLVGRLYERRERDCIYTN